MPELGLGIAPNVLVFLSFSEKELMLLRRSLVPKSDLY